MNRTELASPYVEMNYAEGISVQSCLASNESRNDSTMRRNLLVYFKEMQTAPYEVIVADNGSTDGSPAIAEQRQEQESFR